MSHAFPFTLPPHPAVHTQLFLMLQGLLPAQLFHAKVQHGKDAIGYAEASSV